MVLKEKRLGKERFCLAMRIISENLVLLQTVLTLFWRTTKTVYKTQNFLGQNFLNGIDMREI